MESVAGAQRRIVAGIRPLGPERVTLAMARGRILAAPIVSARVLPPFDNSGMDGVAVASGAVATASASSPVRLAVVGESRAGSPPGRRLVPGTATRILTGAPVPDGADAVVRQEDTEQPEVDGDLVDILVAAVPGLNIRRAGEDMRPGETVLLAGRRLRAADLAVCAALGHEAVSVHRRPRVAILSTGDELVDVGIEPGPGQIVDSNAVAIAAAVEEAGGIPVRIGIARDDLDDLRARLREASACDAVVSSAGVSVGAHDHVRTAVAELGSLDFWRVAMRPGKPLAVGQVGGVPFFGLPGNPVSSQVTFELFARTAILALQGAAEPLRRRTVARALEPFEAAVGLETFLRGVLVPADGAVPGIRLTGPQGSGIMRSMTLADGLVVLAAGSRVEPGELVEVLPLP